MFHTLPKEYQDKLLSENISWEEGDKMYGCPLIGGTALMGFQLSQNLIKKLKNYFYICVIFLFKLLIFIIDFKFIYINFP